MSWTSGTFTRSNGDKSGIDVWQQDANAGINIVDSRHDAHDQDLADGINACLTRDGQNSPTADLPMAGHRHNNVANATARNHYAAAGQVQDNGLCVGGGVAGTDAITFNLAPAITAYATGMVVAFSAAGANSGAVTLNINGVGAVNLYRDGAALTGGELAAGTMVVAVHNGTAFDMIHPASGAGTALSQGTHSILIPAAIMVANTTNGAGVSLVETATNAVMRQSRDFDPTLAESVQITLPMPKSWNEGPVSFIAYWSHPAAATNFGVVWGFAGVAFSDDDPLDAAFGTEVTLADTGGTADDVYITAESGPVTIAGSPAPGDLVTIRVARKPADGADTLAVDARLHAIKMLVTINAGDDS